MTSKDRKAAHFVFKTNAANEHETNDKDKLNFHKKVVGFKKKHLATPRGGNETQISPEDIKISILKHVIVA